MGRVWWLTARGERVRRPHRGSGSDVPIGAPATNCLDIVCETDPIWGLKAIPDLWRLVDDFDVALEELLECAVPAPN
jgi:hypothetical protein